MTLQFDDRASVALVLERPVQKPETAANDDEKNDVSEKIDHVTSPEVKRGPRPVSRTTVAQYAAAIQVRRKLLNQVLFNLGR